MEYPEIAKQIIAMKDKDLSVRNRLIEADMLHEGYHPEMAKIHGENAKALDGIIQQIGFPNINKVGNSAYHAAWLIIQHSIEHVTFMKKCAQLLRIEMHKQQADPVHLAYLEDRIAVFSDEAQQYGTQFDWNEQGEMVPNRIMHPIEQVNERRKRMGLEALEEQNHRIQQSILEDKRKPPADYAEKMQAYNAWRKQVGWI